MTKVSAGWDGGEVCTRQARDDAHEQEGRRSERPSTTRTPWRCRLFGHKGGELEPPRVRVKRFQGWETYCLRCDKRLT